MPVKNTLNDLNNFLFSQLERLDNPELTEDELRLEIKRSKSMSQISKNIIQNAQLSLSAKKYLDSYGEERYAVPDMLKITEGE